MNDMRSDLNSPDHLSVRAELKDIILWIEGENVITKIYELKDQSLSTEEVDKLIDFLQQACLSKMNLLEKVQMHFRGGCMADESRLQTGINCTLGSVCNEKLSLSSDKEKLDALHELMTVLITRYTIAIKLKSFYEGNAFIMFGLSENFDKSMDVPQSPERKTAFYGDTNDTGHFFKIISYIEIPEKQQKLFTTTAEGNFSQRPEHKEILGYQSLCNSNDYLTALMLASAVLNDENIESYLEEIERRNMETEREIARSIKLQQQLSKISLRKFLDNVAQDASAETKRNTALKYLLGRFEEYHLDGYALIRHSNGRCRFLFPHGHAYLEADFKVDSLSLVPEDSLLSGRSTLVEIEELDEANRIIAPILDKFIQLVLASGNL